MTGDTKQQLCCQFDWRLQLDSNLSINFNECSSSLMFIVLVHIISRIFLFFFIHQKQFGVFFSSFNSISAPHQHDTISLQLNQIELKWQQTHTNRRETGGEKKNERLKWIFFGIFIFSIVVVYVWLNFE